MALLLPSTVIALPSTDAPINTPIKAQNAPKSIVEIIDEVAPLFGQDPALISKISYCESKHNKNAIHDGGYGKGVAGFHKSTFNRYNKMYFKEYGEWLNYDSSYDQLKLMSYAFSKGEASRLEWTTYRAYKNGGTYSFYSKLLKRYFTVICK